MRKTLSIILSCFLTNPVQGAVALVQHVTGTSTITTSATTAGNAIVAFCITNGTVCSFTDNATGGSNTYTEAVPARGFLAGFKLQAFVASNIHAGATTITAGGSGAFAQMFEYSGVKTSSPVDVSTGSVIATCIGHACAGNGLSTTNVGDVIASYILANDNCTSVYAPYGHQAGGSGISSADYVPTVTVVGSSATFNCNINNDTFGTSAVALLPQAAAATPSSFGTINNPVPGGI